MEHVERLPQLLVSYLLAINIIEPSKESPIEDAADGFVAGLVHAVGVIEEGQGCGEDLSSGFELVGGLFQLAADAGAFVADGLDFLPEYVFGSVFLGGQVDEVAFFAFALGELCGQ